MSLRSGRRLSSILEPIIDPNKLTITGFYAEDRASGLDKILLVEDIREFGELGIIVDSEEDLVDSSDLVRLETVLNMNYEIIGKKLVSQSGKKLGYVEDYAIDDLTYKVEKIYGRPTALKTLSTNDYVIGRRQIASVSPDEITVKDATSKSGSRSRRPSLNPIR